MRFTYADSMIDPGFYIPLAQAVEQAGYDSFAVPDNIGYCVVDKDVKYPYTQDGARDFLEGKPFLEPFTLIPAMGAVTKTLRFSTLVMKLAIRSPYLTAKQAASVAVLTDNRLIFGVGLSPWPEDYALCGAQWRQRGKRMDEMIDIIRGVTSGEYFSYTGEFYDIPKVLMQPAPTRPIPILIGGHSDAALRRAGRTGDGWMHAGGDPSELADMLNKINAYRREYKRENLPFEVHVISMDAYRVDGLRALEAMGVTDVIVGFRNVYQKSQDTESLQQKIDALSTFAENTVSVFRNG
jgi:probable F420-dependent oxidoreductase